MGIVDTEYTTSNEDAFPIPWATILVVLNSKFAEELEFDNSGFYLLDPTATAVGGPGGLLRADEFVQEHLVGAFQKLAVRQVPGGLAATLKGERVCLYPRLAHSITDEQWAVTGHLKKRSSGSKEGELTQMHIFFNGSICNLDHSEGQREYPTEMEIACGSGVDLRTTTRPSPQLAGHTCSSQATTSTNGSQSF